MQSVSSAFTAQATDSVRNIAHNLQVSWKRESILGGRTFTIGSSTIGGNDVIGANPGAIGSPGNYRYFDESSYVKSLAWERGLSMPTGGVVMGLAEAELENTSGRFTPRYMGGSSELFTSILSRRPFIINAGFRVGGVDDEIPQFSGILSKQPELSIRNKNLRLVGADYIDFFENRYLDRAIMFTSQRTDQVMKTLLQTNLGMSTAQFDLDTGINIIPFGMFDVGTRFSNIFKQLTEAEAGHFFQDESGVFKFKNRQWGDTAPDNEVQKIIYTAQVVDAEAPNDDHIINVVEVRSKIQAKQPERPIMNFNQSTLIEANSTVEIFFNYENPVLEVRTPTVAGAQSYFVANTQDDDGGDDVSSSVQIKDITNFASTTKIIFENTSSQAVFLNHVVISGREVAEIADIYTRLQDDSSVTAFDPQPHVIENPLIQNSSWANSYAQLILNDFAEPENLQKIIIRAMPELQLYDLVSWQGRHWRIFNIQTTLNPSAGFLQELTLLQRTITQYFRIGISTIGSTDQIAP